MITLLCIVASIAFCHIVVSFFGRSFCTCFSVKSADPQRGVSKIWHQTPPNNSTHACQFHSTRFSSNTLWFVAHLALCSWEQKLGRTTLGKKPRIKRRHISLLIAGGRVSNPAIEARETIRQLKRKKLLQIALSKLAIWDYLFYRKLNPTRT